MNEIIQYILCGIVALSASYILFAKNVLYAAFSLVLTFVSIAVIYLTLGADFLAVTQLMIYVGAIVVLIIFGVMLTPIILKHKDGVSHNKFKAFLICAAMFMLLVFAISKNELPQVAESEHGLKSIGLMLMIDYVLIFELAGLLLLIVLIGAGTIASKMKEWEQ